jgi:hypothetical protein
VWVIDEAVKAARQLDDAALLSLDAALAQTREQIDAVLRLRAQPASSMPAPVQAQPLAASPRQAAALVGIGHPLFFREVMPFVYRGSILSCQIGRQRVILLDSLRNWLVQTASIER